MIILTQWDKGEDHIHTPFNQVLSPNEFRSYYVVIQVNFGKKSFVSSEIFFFFFWGLKIRGASQVVKNPPANGGDVSDTGLIPGLGRSPGGGNGNPLQYSCLGNPMDREAWWATVHGAAKSQTRLKWPSTHAHFLSRVDIVLIWIYGAVESYQDPAEAKNRRCWSQTQ